MCDIFLSYICFVFLFGLFGVYRPFHSWASDDCMLQPVSHLNACICLYFDVFKIVFCKGEESQPCQLVENTDVTPEYINMRANAVTKSIHVCFYKPRNVQTGT